MGGTSTKGKKKYRFCLGSYCHVGELSFLGILGLITTFINEQVNRPSFLLTTFFLLSMGECVLEAEIGSMRGEFLCATAADIFFSMTKSGMGKKVNLWGM